jgi:hypothetical protein
MSEAEKLSGRRHAHKREGSLARLAAGFWHNIPTA